MVQGKAVVELKAVKALEPIHEAQLLTLGERRFDAAVCTMGIMDIAAIDPLFAALSRLLKPGGHFVFSVMHPCFNNGNPLVAEQIETEQSVENIFAVKIVKYLTPRTDGIAIRLDITRAVISTPPARAQQVAAEGREHWRVCAAGVGHRRRLGDAESAYVRRRGIDRSARGRRGSGR